MGLEFDELSELPSLPPLRTAARSATTQPEEGTDDAGCVTPTSDASVLPPALECPPAPRKPRRGKRKCRGRRPLSPTPQGFFTVPHDLAEVFVARVTAPSSLCTPTKKIRVHVVG